MTQITLNWTGPFRPLRGEENLPSTKSGVYAAIYPNQNEFPQHAKTGIYFGYSHNLQARTLEHCKMTLGGYYALFNPASSKKTAFCDIMDKPRLIKDFSDLTCRTAKQHMKMLSQTTYFFAETDNVDIAKGIEKALILTFWNLCKEENNTYVSCNLTLKGCRRYYNDLEIINSGERSIMETFKNRIIHFNHKHQSTVLK